MESSLKLAASNVQGLSIGFVTTNNGVGWDVSVACIDPGQVAVDDLDSESSILSGSGGGGFLDGAIFQDSNVMISMLSGAERILTVAVANDLEFGPFSTTSLAIKFLFLCDSQVVVGVVNVTKLDNVLRDLNHIELCKLSFASLSVNMTIFKNSKAFTRGNRSNHNTISVSKLSHYDNQVFFSKEKNQIKIEKIKISKVNKSQQREITQTKRNKQEKKKKLIVCCCFFPLFILLGWKNTFDWRSWIG
jgi:hypothetical protein